MKEKMPRKIPVTHRVKVAMMKAAAKMGFKRFGNLSEPLRVVTTSKNIQIKILRYEPGYEAKARKIFFKCVEKLKISNGGLYPDEIMQKWQDWARTPGLMQTEFDEMKVNVLVALVQNKIVGFFGYQDHSTSDIRLDIGNKDEFARVRYLFVDPDYHGLGIGSKLYDSVLDYVKQAGYKNIYAYVILSAHDFYQRKGMKHFPHYDTYFSEDKIDGITDQGRVLQQTNERLDSLCTHVGENHYTKEKERVLEYFFFEQKDI